MMTSLSNIIPSECVGKTFSYRYGEKTANVIDYFTKWVYDVPPFGTDDYIEYFTIEEEGERTKVECWQFLHNYTLKS